MQGLKNAVFALLPLVVLVVVIESILALAGFEALDGDQDPYLGFTSEIPLFEATRGEDGQRVWRTAESKRRFFNDQRFALRKREGVKRIFCLGGSTTYGRPHHDPTSFCGWLREYLIAVEPEVHWEVVNAGGISYASYRVANVARELAGYEPDLLIVYTGHNEFLEDRTYGELRDRPVWLRKVDLALRRSRLYSEMSKVLRPEPEQLDAEVTTRLDRSIGPNAYRRDDAWRRAVIDHFRMNLDRIVAIASDAGSELVFVSPADNLRDCTPFKSEAAAELAEAERVRFASLMDRARSSSEPRPLLEAAVEIDPRHAEALFLLGRALLADGENAAAERTFVRARDEDVCPLRALSPMVEIVREVAEANGVARVDYPALIDAASGPGVLVRGADWFLDHVHPTVEGHGLLARALLEQVVELGWVDRDRAADVAALASARHRVEESLDERESGLALRNLAKVLSWAGKNEDAARAAERALDVLGPDAECLFILSLDASGRGDHRRAISFLREAVRLDAEWVKARHNLAVELARAGRDQEAVTQYDAVIGIAPEHPSVRFNRANALSRLGRHAEAVADYRAALELDPEDADARHNLENTLARASHAGSSD
jgi:tetratricopeptide (TPR) repeat protein